MFNGVTYFNQDLSSWTTKYISYKPSNFDTGISSSFLNHRENNHNGEIIFI